MRWLLVPFACLTLTACSPLVRVRAKVSLADGKALDVHKVHFRAVASCDSSPLTPQLPDAGPGFTEAVGMLSFEVDRDAGLADASVAEPAASAAIGRSASVRNVPWTRVEKDSLAFEVHGATCNVGVTAWYDASGDGVVGPGDYVGNVGPVLVHDRGWCAGNMNDIGPLVLKPQ